MEEKQKKTEPKETGIETEGGGLDMMELMPRHISPLGDGYPFPGWTYCISLFVLCESDSVSIAAV